MARQAERQRQADKVLPAALVCDVSLSDYVRQAWHVIEPDTEYQHNWHIDAICEHLAAVTDGQIKNLIINIPPRHAKSTLVCVMWPTWVWHFRPASRWLFSSYADNLATRDSLKCRRLLQSAWYQRQWGDRWKFAGDQNQKTRFENDKSGIRLATGVGGAGTGEGGDFVICDDPHKALEAYSQVSRERVKTWWLETMSTRLNDPKTGARVIIMQRLHEDDLTGALLTLGKEGGTQYEHLCIPVEYNRMHPTPSTRFADPRQNDGDLLWPERYSREKIAQLKRELGAYGTSGQLQQMPSPATGGIFKREHWRYWQPAGMKLPDVPVRTESGTVYVSPVDLPARFDKQAQSWDCAFKASADNDNVAGQVWGCLGANKYLLDYSLDKMNITGTMDAILGFTGRWPGAIEKLIEDTANGPAVIQLLTNRVAGLIAVSPAGGKLARAWSAQPEVESGNVYLPHPALYPWVNQFVDNCAMFPNAAHDDDVDAFTQIIIRWQTNFKRPIVG